MSLTLLPQTIVSDIVVRCLYQEGCAKGWELRRVCNAFNDEVLYAFFVLQINSQVLGFMGSPAGYARDSFLAMARLRANIKTYTTDMPAWLINMREALSMLHSKTSRQMCHDHVLLDQRRYRFPLFGRIDSRIVSDDWASEAICGAVVSYFELSEVNENLSRNADSAGSEYLERSPTFWIFAAACYAGRMELLCSALVELQVRFECMGGRGARDPKYFYHGLQGKGERQIYHWKDALAPCLSIAARRGHAQVVHYLLECRVKAGAVSPQGTTALLAAVEAHQVRVLEILLEPSRELQPIWRGYDDAVIKAAQTCNDALRWTILKLLTDNDSRKLSQKARDIAFFFASEVSDVPLAEWAMSHGPVDLFHPKPWFIGSVKPLSLAVHNNHTGLFRLIMNSIDNFVPATEQKRFQTFAHAYDAACRKGKLEAFLPLVKVHLTMTPERAFIQAAMVDGASALIEDLMGSIHIQNAHPDPIAGSGTTIGEKALYNAISMLRPQNLEFLVRRGCLLGENSTICLGHYATAQVKLDPTLRPRVEAMLAEHGLKVHFKQY